MNEKEMAVVVEEQKNEIVMLVNETCSDCRYFNAGRSECELSDVSVDPDRRACSEFRW